ncbi:MAG: Sporulation related domain, partial [Candidatus Aminicenantes bacterium]|nr:Sporulation related domain [Candidatus Aminicenantes bacterium]
MKNKDFREIQVSSSLLVVIFLGVLALGVFIFLLGVSVGKKQVRLTAPTQIVTQPIAEPVKEQPVKPSPADTESAAVAPVSGEPAPKSAPPAATVKAPVEKAPVETKKTAPPPVTAATGLYYVQVGAFTERAQAQAAADRYKKQGYTAVVANPKLTDTKNWYRVRLGGYASRDRAVDLLAKLNAAAGKKTDFRVVQ